MTDEAAEPEASEPTPTPTPDAASQTDPATDPAALELRDELNSIRALGENLHG